MLSRLSVLVLYVVISVVVSVTPGFAQLPQIAPGLTYLNTSQNPDGTWGSGTSLVETTNTTVSALETLKSLNQATGSAYTTATTWLQSQSPVAVDYQAQRIHALGLTDTSINALIPLLDQLKHAWGGDDGYEDDNLDTASALQALKAASYTEHTLIYNAINYLLITQNSDGGWGFVQDDDSNVYITAQVLSALAQFTTTYLTGQQLSSTATFLLSKQNPDGGFGVGLSTVFETALAFIALSESGQVQSQPLQNALNYLTTTQLPNGSWNDDPYSSALALRALSYVKPDLSIVPSNIAVLPSTPAVGSSITVTVTVTNIGLESAGNITVHLLDNGTTVGDQTIAAIAPGATGQAVYTIAPLTPTGEHNLTITVDPLNTINEIAKTNNSATARIWASAPADLVVLPEYLTITPAYPKPAENITFSFQIANMGETTATNVAADLYDGNPANGGVKLGNATVSSINAGGLGSGTITFNLAAAGSHTLYLIADPLHAITETSVTNNNAQKTVNVNATGGTGFIDLTIPMNGLRITPQRPHAGEAVTVTLLAENLGTEVASADVELFDGNPAAGGIQLYKSAVTLNAGESRTISVPWQIPSGIRTLYASIDRANTMIERDKTNNSQTLTVMADMVDIEISASDISITPEHPMDGDPATVTAIIQNRGIANTGAFNVNLYNGDPASGGTLLQTFAITNLAGDATQTLSYPFTAARGTYRFYVICDPENRVTELHTDNNLAIRSLLVKKSAEAKGPDLVPLEFDLSGTTTDPQSLRISGTAKVKFQNKGDDKVTTPFRITVFEDKDNDGIYTEGIDLFLGSWDYSTPMNPNMVGIVSINLAGTVTFRDAPLYAMLDSGQVIFEQNKNNNSIRKGSACENRPDNPIEPVLKWKWKSPAGAVQIAPVVINLTDHNGDGVIDNKDVPDIVFGYNNSNATFSAITALRGDTGATVFNISDINHPAGINSMIAAGDIDGDGLSEIIATRGALPNVAYLPGFIAYGHDGQLKWDNFQQVKEYNTKNPNALVTIFQTGAPVLTDLNGDGKPAIIMGASVINADGSIRWVAKDWVWPYLTSVGLSYSNIYHSIVADLDMDGKSEIIAGNTVYNSDGTTKWWNKALRDGNNAIVNFNDDPYPEIVLITSMTGATNTGGVYLLDHNGNVIWGPVYANDFVKTTTGGINGPLIIADFDGDGEPEIGLRGINNYFILDRNGKLKTTLSMPYVEETIGPQPTVFDLNGDGRPEVIFNGAYLRIYDGKDGSLLYKEKTGSSDSYQGAIVVDVDGDNHAEIVAHGYDNGGFGGYLSVYGAKNNDWVNTRRIWNQASYHVTNINDDGSIPKNETPSWLTNNNYRCNVPTTTGPNPYQASDLSASFVRVDMANYPISVTITARIGNGGAKTVDPGLKTTFHDGDPANGGTLIGSALTTKTLNPGDYEDVTLVWNSPSEGNHTIRITADADNTQSECDKTNNSVSLPVNIASGKPDLSIAAADIIAPATIPEGSLTDILVTVRNIGSLQADNVLVRLYTGNPAAGGTQIGSDRIVPTIAAGGTATLKTTWNTLGAAGVSYLYALVDPASTTADANRGNNTANRQIIVTAAVKPDLQISAEDITITPASPIEGDTLTITATIHNRGSQTGAVKVALYDGNPAAGGIKRGETIIPLMIAQGGSAIAIFPLDTIGLSGSHPLYLRIDPDNAIDESDKTNNQASRSVTIAASGLTLSITTNKSAYSANEIVLTTITATELSGMGRSLAYDLLIIDDKGVQAASLPETALTLVANATQSSNSTWSSGSTYAGSYTVMVRIKENSRIIAKATIPFTITPVKTADTRIVVDKTTYHANEQVAISATVTGTSPNYIFTGLSAKTSVLDGAGQLLCTTTRTIPSLASGQRVEVNNYWNTVTNPSGAYLVTLQLHDGATVISASNSTFTLTGSAASGDGLTGTVATPPNAVEVGSDIPLSYTITNQGNQDLTSFGLSLLVVDPATGQQLKTIDAGNGLSMAMSGSKTGSVSFTTTGIPPITLLAILQYSFQGTVKSLASAPFTVTDTTAPLLTVSTLANGVYTNNQVLNVAGTATDASGIKSLVINGADTPLNQDGSFSKALILQPGPNTVTVVATDLGNNSSNDTRIINLDMTAPLLSITAPSDNVKVAAQSMSITGTVNEASAVTVKLGSDIRNAVMNGTAFNASVNLSPGINTIEITATDQANNTSTQKRTVVYDDQTPSLAITVPIQDVRTNQATLLVKGTASDPYTAVTVGITMDGQTYSPSVVDGQFEQLVSFSTEKSYAIVVTATNEVSKSASIQRNVLYDITSPALAINPVTTPVSQTDQIISGTREGGLPVTVTCPTATAGTVSYPADTTWSVALTGLTAGDNTISVTSVDPAGNQAAATTMITVTAANSNLFSYAVFANKSVTLSGSSYLDSYVGTPSSYVAGKYKHGNVGIDSTQLCGIKLTGAAIVYGSASVGVGGSPATAVCTSISTTVTGGSSALAVTKVLTPVAAPTGYTSLGALNLSGVATKTLTTGTYRYSSITLGGSGKLNTSGQVILIVDGNISVSGAATFVVTSGSVVMYANGTKLDIGGGSFVNMTQNPSSLIIYGSSALTTVNLSGGTSLHGLIHTPAAAVKISGSQQTFGAIIGNTVDLSGATSVHFPEGL
jgi:subtilase family serine protease